MRTPTSLSTGRPTLLQLAFLSLAAAVCASHAEDLDPLGRAWGKKIQHFDETVTNSRKDSDQNVITEDTFDQSKKLVVRRMFYLDVEGNLRRGIIYDGKMNPKAQTFYSYVGKTMVEEQMYNAQGNLIRRLFPPGVLPNVPQNQKRSISVTIDPKTQSETARQATDERPVEPITEAQKTFNPGVDMGSPLRNDRMSIPKEATNPTRAPAGRVPMIPQRR